MTDSDTIKISKLNARRHDNGLHSNDFTAPRCYQIAGQSIVFSSRVDSLDKFYKSQEQPNSQTTQHSLPVGLLDAGNARQYYQGHAPFNGADQLVTYWQAQQVGQINIGEQAVCQIDLQQQQIFLLNERSFDEQLNLEIVTGPALIVLLALKGIFCLHASAVATDIGNIIFVAESGVGKSMLAKHQSKQWQQLADDILPISRNHQAFRMQAFPQLKLAGCIPQQKFPAMAGIDLIVRLSGRRSDKTQFRQLPRREALLEIVRHTVASKMFDADQLRAQMQFAQELSQSVPMLEVRYPRDLTAIDELRKAIIEQASKVV